MLAAIIFARKRAKEAASNDGWRVEKKKQVKALVKEVKRVTKNKKQAEKIVEQVVQYREMPDLSVLNYWLEEQKELIVKLVEQDDEEQIIFLLI